MICATRSSRPRSRASSAGAPNRPSTPALPRPSTGISPTNGGGGRCAKAVTAANGSESGLRSFFRMAPRQSPNVDPETIAGFGQEWAAFDQSALSEDEQSKLFERYFAIFPFDVLPGDAEGF